MKNKNPAKELYQSLRQLSCRELWEREVAAFDRATGQERMARVAVVRAVGVVFSESGTGTQREQARAWLRGLLDDPLEKVRRYAMTALPKLGADAGEEADLLGLLEKASSDREKKFVGRALEKIGGEATLEIAAGGRLGRRAAANAARRTAPGAVNLDRELANASTLHVHLHCRAGLEGILADELREQGARFRTIRTEPGLVTAAPAGGLRLADVYALRCFAAAGIELGVARNEDELAEVIASPDSLRVLQAFTEGPIRYRLEFVGSGHRRGAIRSLADRVYERCPALLNDSRDATWQIDLRRVAAGISAELTPRLRPDPRFAYRRGDVPAASHPPLAAAMARVAGGSGGEVVWDPFCGSGLELVECALRGGVRAVFGTDLSAQAVATARENFSAAIPAAVRATFAVSDFRDHAKVAGLDGVSLVISNPPMGRRVPIPNLRGLIEDLFAAAEGVLRPGGRLVFANPLAVEPRGGALKREFRQRVDLGGFDVRVEKYVKRR